MHHASIGGYPTAFEAGVAVAQAFYMEKKKELTSVMEAALAKAMTGEPSKALSIKKTRSKQSACSSKRRDDATGHHVSQNKAIENKAIEKCSHKKRPASNPHVQYCRVKK